MSLWPTSRAWVQSHLILAPRFPATETGYGVMSVLKPLVGAVGSFLTGSTTSSNALFAVLQHDVAGLLDIPAAVLLAGQTVGGNVGNALAPVVIVIGLAAIQRTEDTSKVLRMALPPALVLLTIPTVLVPILAILL